MTLVTQWTRGPISALVTADNSVFFGVANQLFRKSLSCQSETVDAPLFCLQNGAVVTSITVTGEEGSSSILVSSRDHVFSYCPGDVKPSTILNAHGNRISSLFYDEESNLTLAVCATGAVFWSVSPMTTLIAATEEERGTLWNICEIENVGVILACCCKKGSVKQRSIGELCVDVYAAGYAGSVEVIQVGISPSSRTATVQRVCSVAAHPSGCAVFAVKVAECSVSGKTVRVLVTCSDDRSVKSFYSIATDASLTGQWELLWDGSGEEISRARIFDCSVPLVNGEGDCLQVYIGFANEDGQIQVTEIGLDTTSQTVRNTKVSFSALLHGGHGAWKVALCSANNAVRVVSGGFDGVVTSTPFACQQNSTVPALSVPMVNAVDGPAETGAQQIRGILVDSAHTTLCVYEFALGVFRDGTPAQRISWLQDLTTRFSVETPVLKQYLSASLCVAAQRESGTSTALAIVGCSNGYVVTVAYPNEIPSVNVFPTLKEYQKCLLVQSFLRQTGDSDKWETLLISTHVTNQTVVSVLRDEVLSPVCVLENSPGLGTTTLEYKQLSWEKGFVMAGDKKGFVHLYKCELGEALDPNGAVARCRKSGQVKLFTASVGIIALSEDGESALVVSRSGEYHTLQVADYDSGETSDKTSSVMFSFPRRLPFDVSNVWHYSSGLVVTQFGEEVSVYGKGQASPLCRLYAFKGVRAPRLITCTVSNNELRFSFCNDGKTIESVFYPLDKQDYLGVTCVLHGGCGSGKDANTIAYSPHKNEVVIGNEDSTISLIGKDSGSLVSFAGPHYSNILASGVLHDRYIVTVGSLATVVVWSPSWSVLAAHTEESATQTKESVARCLSVLALDETRFLVGGSDGVVSLYRFTMDDGLELLSKSTVASSYPKPVLSLAKVVQEGEPTLIVSGDSGGRLIVSTVDESDRFTVRTETTVSKCSINCLDATMQRSENGNSFRGVCGCDSGSILVFEVTTDSFAVRVLLRYDVGVTPLRSILGESHSSRFVAVNDEFAAVFYLTDDKLVKSSQTRVNVKCVSGACFGESADSVLVCGQGVECLSLITQNNT